MLHLHLRRRREPLLLLLKPRLLWREARLLKARLLLWEARLLLESLLRLAAERGGAASELLLRRIALLGRKPLLLGSITRLLRKLLRWIALLLLGITLLRRREARLAKTHGRLLHLGPIQGRRRRRGARVVVRNELLQPLCVRLSFRARRI